MASVQTSRFFTLLQREFREYRNSLFWAPVITAGLLCLLMLGSVILVNRISVFGDLMLSSSFSESAGVNVSISVLDDEESDEPITFIDVRDAGIEESGEVTLDYHLTVDGKAPQTGTTRIRFGDGEDNGAVPQPPSPPSAPAYEWVVQEDAPAETWNFSRDWHFNPDGKDDDGEYEERDLTGRELNPMLSVVHGILLLILLITSANYLLSSLYDDRKDRSILFYRSMPVSEWEVVLSKFVMALLVAPLLYIAISLLLQLAYVVLMMLLAWRMDKDPFDQVVGNIDFFALMTDPVSGWLLTALWIAPAYAWLLLASSAAKRSPFMLATLPIVGLAIAEAVFMRGTRVLESVNNHLPHVSDTSAVGFYLFGPNWQGIDLLSMGAGLLFAAIALLGAVWLRRNRWEL